MESYQWQYQPTPEEFKKAKLVPMIFGINIHLILPMVLGFMYWQNPTTNFGIILALVFMGPLLAWHLYLKKVLKLGRTINTIDERGIRIVNLDTNIKKSYKWDNIKSFTRVSKLYIAPSIPVSENDKPDKHIYVSTGKNSKGVYSFFILRVTENERSKVAEILSTRLEEKK